MSSPGTTSSGSSDRARVSSTPVDLVERAKARDRAAFTALYRAYGRMVHGIVLARVERDSVADLVQDVFELAWRQLPQLEQPEAFGSWLATIARRRAAARRARPVASEPLPELRDPVSTTSHVEARAILRLIRSLPEAYREPLVLRLVEGMSGPEIAARTGLTAGSVRVNLHRGTKLLRRKLGRDDQGGRR